MPLLRQKKCILEQLLELLALSNLGDIHVDMDFRNHIHTQVAANI